MTNEPLQKYRIISVTSLFFIFLNDKMINQQCIVSLFTMKD